MWMLYFLISPFVLLVLSFIFRFLVDFLKGKRIPKRVKPPRKSSILKRLFLDFPRVFFNDLYNRDPDSFGEYGLHLVCGEQGSGKTICVAYMLRDLRRRYPNVKVATNFFYSLEDEQLEGWQDLIFKNNGIKGQVDVLDEIQNWFNSAQSKDFPVEMVQEISQQRKQRKMIIGTAQVFNRVAKPIREQVNLVYRPITLFGCLTVVRVYKPSLSDDGTIKKARMRKMFFFVHDEELRNSYDTYRKIAMLAKGGFAPRQWEQTVNVTRLPGKD